MKAHLQAHWHHHLSIAGIAAAAAIVLVAGATTAAVIRHLHAGYQPGPMPPRIAVIGGPALPASYSLSKYVVRVHNQGNSSSCVGQTLSTIEEIARRLHSHTSPAFSAGYIYDQTNGGVDQGTSYQAAFGVLTAQGDATLASFPHDGQDWSVQPTSSARANASHYRFKSFRSINPSDRHTMQAEIHASRPLAIAIPIRDTLYSAFGSCNLITSDTGTFHFFHSITGIGYSPAGITILNSWGPAYGCNGRITLSWGLLANDDAAIVISTPVQPPKSPRKPPPPPSSCAKGLTTPPVYHPDRLKLLAKCASATGQILAVLHESDGDTHIWLKPTTTTTTKLLNAKNLYHGQKALVLEIVPVCKTTPANSSAAAHCPKSTIKAPTRGAKITVTGPFVLDHVHGWQEIHPVSSLRITAGARHALGPAPPDNAP